MDNTIQEVKRITMLSGHYGSGKTNIAVNLAVSLAKAGKSVCIYDLDIVNPYYRTLDAKAILDSNGISLVVSDFANSNVDVPSLKGQSFALTADKSKLAVVDIGGDDRGAMVLGRFRKEILAENNYDFVFVLNKFRPETSSLDAAILIFKEIEQAAGIKFTQIASNGNLGEETTTDIIHEGLKFSEEFAGTVGLPIFKVGVPERFEDETKNIYNRLLLNMIKYLSF